MLFVGAYSLAHSKIAQALKLKNKMLNDLLVKKVVRNIWKNG